MEIIKYLYDYITNLDYIFVFIILGTISIFIHALPELINYLQNKNSD